MKGDIFMNKCIKLKIIKPYKDDCTWKELGKIFRDSSYASMKTANYVMIENLLRARQPKEEREPPKDFVNRLYAECTTDNKTIATTTINQAIRLANQTWSAHGKNVLSGHESLPNFKLDMPIELHNRLYKICYDEESKEYYVDVQLQSSKTDKTRYKFVISSNKRDESAKVLLDKLYRKEKKLRGGKISHKGKNYMLIISYEVENKPLGLDKNRIMGIDLGIAKAAYYGFNFCLKRGYIDGNEIQHFRHKIYERRKSIQNQYKYSNRKGHGRNRALKPVESLKHKETNFRNTTNFKYANYLVEQALRNSCGKIQMEKLEGMADGESSRFLKNWTYFDLRQKIKNKAEENGIDFVEINPQYTSQRCSKCGHIHKDNRKTQEKFLCVNCGYEANADYNAAVNIATEGIEDIIKNELDKKKVLDKIEVPL